MRCCRTLIFATTSGLAAMSAHAGPLYLFDQPAACADWTASDHSPAALGEVIERYETVALHANGLVGHELVCHFEPAVNLLVESGAITTHVGHCLGPGWVEPQLFTFSVDPIYDHTVAFYNGSETPEIFHFCTE